MPASTFMVIAHRGASAYAPENTLAAFDLALRIGARQLEMDLQATSDGHIVVLHDDTLDRTSDGSGPVAEQPLAALRKLDAGSWFGAGFGGAKIPTFEEVLARYRGRARIHAEIKGRAAFLAQAAADSIRRHGMAEQVTVTCFELSRLEEIRAYAPELQTGWLLVESHPAALAEARTLGLTQICPSAGTLTAETVRRLHGDGFVVRAWGVDTEELMRRVVETGADGMTVNFPDKLIAYLNSRGHPWT